MRARLNLWERLPSLARVQVGFAVAGLVLAGLLLTTPGNGLIALIGFCLVALMPAAVVFFVGLPVAVHELGHYFAARVLGIQVVGFNILGKEFITNAARGPNPAQHLGFVRLKTNLAQDNPCTWIPCLVAGPLAGLAFAGAEWLLAERVHEGLSGFIRIQAQIGLYCSIASLVPIRFNRKSGQPRSDGALVLDVLRPDSYTFAYNSLLRIASIARTENMNDMTSEDLRRAMRSHDPIQRAYAAGLNCYRAIAFIPSEAMAASRNYLALAEATRGAPDLQDLTEDACLESAFCSIVFSNDRGSAEELLGTLSSIRWDNWFSARRVDATLLLALGDVEEAQKRIAEAYLQVDRAQAAQPKAPWNNERRLLALVDEACEESLRSTSSA